MLKRLLLVVLSLIVVTAHAQFTPGQILTAAQLNGAFSNVLPVSGGTLTGPLSVPSLSVTGAPIPIASGGTGATTASGALTSIGGGLLAQSFFVSNTAANGFPVGSDSNQGGFTSPFLTLQHALAVAPANSKIVLNCGTYTPAASANFKLTQSVDIEAITPTSLSSESCVVLTNASGQASVVEVSAASVNVKLGGVALDGQSATTQALLIDNSATGSTITVDGVLFNNVGTDGAAEQSAGNFTFNARNIACVGTVADSCLSFPKHAAGPVSINGLAANVTSTNTTTLNGALLNFDGTAAGIAVSISNVTGNVAFSTSSAAENNGIYIRNANAPSVHDIGVPYGQAIHAGSPQTWPAASYLVFSGGNPSSGCTPIEISTDSTTPIETDNARVYNNWIVQNCPGGGHSSILINADGDPGTARRNMVNYARIYNNRDTAGATSTAASNLEGPLCGWSTDCWIYDSVIENWPGLLNAGYGPIEKGVIGGYVFGNLVLNPIHTGALIKGGSELNGGVGPQFWNNTILWNITPTSATTVIGFDEVIDENNAPATGWVIANNNVINLAGGNLTVRYNYQTIASGCATAGCGNTGTFSNNNWYGPVVSTGWEAWNNSTYAINLYPSLATWQSGGTCSGSVSCPAVESTATAYTPALTNEYQLNAGSALISAGAAVPASVTTDLKGSLFTSTPSVGAFQYLGSNSPSTSASTSAANTWSAAQLFTATTWPTFAAGQLALGGVAAVPALGATGEGACWLSTSSGLSCAGYGSTYDFRLYNHSGSAVLSLATAGTSFTVAAGVNVTSSAGVTSTNYSLTNMLSTTTAPTISSGFGTSPSVAANNGTAAFTVNVGTGGTASSGVIALQSAVTGWICQAVDMTTPAANNTKQSASSKTTVTLTNYNASGTAAAWAASDVLGVTCSAY